MIECRSTHAPRFLLAGAVFFATWSFTSDAEAQGYAREEVLRHMTVAEGFEVTLVAAEPLVRQPVAIEFDDRGRLWVIQYQLLAEPRQLAFFRKGLDHDHRTSAACDSCLTLVDAR